ncbi:hypothetical protein PR003_g22793 [Phytophthora rubi]|uniref:Tc1-like transposase DDE domain-containing protein n=1 Tax=Phytophthora rubi TaxID=129364 RepID=A0A6A3JKI7_9STRA|nr:hypothetical protein PR001_g20480 [Phytophthora rubi]KAE8996203.1 hypothetical protein PR002_g19389 [Phytophthora rubi]KAE9300244.1 hypothetical protein PR003_g22793 [Phytophthora rubi]
MPSSTPPSKTSVSFERAQAKARVVRAFQEGKDWKEVATANDVNYHTAHRAVLAAGAEPKQRSGLRPSSVKMTVEVMSKLEELIDEDCRITLEQLRDRLHSDLGVDVSVASVHRALQGMLYSTKRLRIEKQTMNSSANKEKRKTFVAELNKHIKKGNMVVFQDETNFNLYLSRNEGWSRIGERVVVQLPPSKGSNLHVQDGVSSGSGLVLLQTHESSVKKQENARFMADLFVAALRLEEYEELQPAKVVIVTDNAPSHSEVERLAREYLAADGIVNLNKFVVLRLGPYSPMLNPIEGCWNSLKAKMRRFMAEKRQEFLVRGEYATFTEHRMQLMKEAVEFGKKVITARLVWYYERHCLRHCFAAEKGDDMQLGA